MTHQLNFSRDVEVPAAPEIMATLAAANAQTHRDHATMRLQALKEKACYVTTPHPSGRRLLLLVLLTGLVPILQAAEFVGSSSCQGCHEPAFEAWQKSHHYQAMLEPTEKTVLGNFDNQNFEYAGLRHRFFTHEGGYWVETDNAEGELEAFKIAFTFGFYPLQQYLIGIEDGRFQALNIVWDSRPEKEGGQRWFHLYPNEAIDHEDILHWTGAFQNWNSRCASCHSTDLKKNYNAAANSYQTTFSEINVACEACHGPGSDHVSWAQQGIEETRDELPNKGLSVNLINSAVWERKEKQLTANRVDGSGPTDQIAVCAGCHSRRSEMSSVQATGHYADMFRLRLLEQDLYFPDGQIDQEVYVFGSFLQSKMYAAGVTCTNCHQPHGDKLLVSGNGLCAQCHDADTFNAQDHHHHRQASPGAECVNCHMPARTYMGVDDRRDHSFRIPEPRLSTELGTPNACNKCHDDKDPAWASEALKHWGVSDDVRASHAPVLAQARSNNSAVAPRLHALAKNSSYPAILRATAMLETRRFPNAQGWELLQGGLQSADELIRVATVRSLDWMTAPERYSILQPLVSDPVRSVRMEVANRLADIPLEQLPPDNRQALGLLRNEYLKMLNFNADMPESLLNLGIFLAAVSQPIEAERAYRQALKLSPRFVPAMLNLADLYRENGLDSKVEALLAEAITIAPDQPAAHHALGLLRVRGKEMSAALESLGTAYRLQPGNQRFAYVYGVALHSANQYDKAITVLEGALEANPGNQELISALMSFYQQQGDAVSLKALQQRYSQ